MRLSLGMQDETMLSRSDRLLQRWYPLGVVAALLFILYCNIYLWFFLPFDDFTYGWRPDSRLYVFEVLPDSTAAPFLQVGDRLLAVDGRPVQRMRALYLPPLRGEHEYVVERAGRRLTYRIPTISQPPSYLLETLAPAGVIALVSWLLGAVLLYFAEPENVQARRAGAVFVLGAVALMGVQAGLEGVPGAWIAGHVLIFFLPPGFLYLGLIPRIKPLTARRRRLLTWLLLPATLLALAGVYEVLFLFPQPTSFQDLTGVSLYALGLLLSALGLVAIVVTLAWRVRRLPSGAYLRQQLTILLAFIALGILPAALLTFIPRALFDAVLLPFPLAILLLLLVPAGYFYVIFRRGFLGLDLLFGRLLRLIVLFLLAYGFYAGGSAAAAARAGPGGGSEPGAGDDLFSAGAGAGGVGQPAGGRSRPAPGLWPGAPDRAVAGGLRRVAGGAAGAGHAGQHRQRARRRAQHPPGAALRPHRRRAAANRSGHRPGRGGSPAAAGGSRARAPRAARRRAGRRRARAALRRPALGGAAAAPAAARGARRAAGPGPSRPRRLLQRPPGGPPGPGGGAPRRGQRQHHPL